MDRRPGELFLDRVALAERHGHELADHPFLDAITVEPGLLGQNHIVLRVPVQMIHPGVARDRADLAGRHLHGEGIARVEVDPQRLGLVHRRDHAAPRPPRLRQLCGVIVEMTQRKGTEARR